MVEPPKTVAEQKAISERIEAEAQASQSRRRAFFVPKPLTTIFQPAPTRRTTIIPSPITRAFVSPTRVTSGVGVRLPGDVSPVVRPPPPPPERIVFRGQETIRTEELQRILGERERRERERREALTPVQRAFEMRFFQPLEERLAARQPRAPQAVKFLGGVLGGVGAPLSLLFGPPEIRREVGKLIFTRPDIFVEEILKGTIEAPVDVVRLIRQRRIGEAFGAAATLATIAGVSGAAGRLVGPGVRRLPGVREPVLLKGLAKPTRAKAKLISRAAQKKADKALKRLQQRRISPDLQRVGKILERKARRETRRQKKLKKAVFVDRAVFDALQAKRATKLQRRFLGTRARGKVVRPPKVKQPRVERFRDPIREFRAALERRAPFPKPLQRLSGLQKLDRLKILEEQRRVLGERERFLGRRPPRGKEARKFRRLRERQEKKSLEKQARRLQRSQAEMQRAAQKTVQKARSELKLRVAPLEAQSIRERQRQRDAQAFREAQKQLTDETQKLLREQIEETGLEEPEILVPLVSIPRLPPTRLPPTKLPPLRPPRRLPPERPPKPPKEPPKPPRRPPLPRPPFFIPKPTRKALVPTKPGYDAFVKVRGKVRKLTKKPRTRTTALSIGGSFVDRTPAGSFTIKRAGRVASGREIGTWPLIRNKFRPRRTKKALRLVEKNAFRIDSIGEVLGIPLAPRKGVDIRRVL